MLLETQVGRKSDYEHPYMITGSHSICAEMQDRSMATQQRNVVFGARQEQFSLSRVHLQTIYCHPMANVIDRLLCVQGAAKNHVVAGWYEQG